LPLPTSKFSDIESDKKQTAEQDFMSVDYAYNSQAEIDVGLE